ncbi:MAG: AmmeMemoRadiSam system protein A [Candidatus Margulisiibacteriota bacterium]
MHAIVELAKRVIEKYIRENKIADVPEDLPQEMEGRAGVFVSIHNADGSLRGCIGTFAPTQKNVAEEIIMNAISAATKDPRFPAIEANELDGMDISVDVLTTPVLIKDKKDLDAKKYGVIVKSGYRRGLLLPDLPGVDTPDQQIEICRMKGGIGKNDPVELYRFEVKRYH